MPTFIAKNSKVEDYFILIDKPKNITDVYEKGKVIIFDNCKPYFESWRTFLEENVKCIMSSDPRIKKAKHRDLLHPIRRGEWHILTHFTQYPNKLQDIIKNSYSFIRYNLFKTFFPKYKIVDENWTWRLTVTEKEEMHLDSYGDTTIQDLHSVRMFINLDNTPRVWRVSHPLERIYKDYIRIINAEATSEIHPNEVNHILNKNLFWKGFPFHEIHFAPYSMWMCNSQLIPHQAYRGNKLAAYTFRIDPKTMLYPELKFTTLGHYYRTN